jgi:hypothetical protein
LGSIIERLQRETAMTKCSKWLPATTKPQRPVRQYPSRPEPKADIDALEGRVAAIRKRRKDGPPHYPA